MLAVGSSCNGQRVKVRKVNRKLHVDELNTSVVERGNCLTVRLDLTLDSMVTYGTNLQPSLSLIDIM